MILVVVDSRPIGSGDQTETAAINGSIQQISALFQSVLHISNESKIPGAEDLFVAGNPTLTQLKALSKQRAVYVIYDLLSTGIPISSLNNLGIKVLYQRDIIAKIEFNGIVDSWLIRQVFDLDWKEELLHELNFEQMYNRSSPVPRLVTVQCDYNDGVMPYYRHPADEMPIQFPWTKSVKIIKERVERIVGHSLNHALIQLYRDSRDFIKEHSDKTLDITPGSKIVTVTFGAGRFLILSAKDSLITQNFNILLESGSVFVLGLETNKKMKHAISKHGRQVGERLSLTFRQIHTFTDGTLIWGGGATGKSRQDAKPMNKSQSPELINIFGLENRDPEFDSEVFYYRRGFD